ncbi:NAD(P)H-dependent oxidoreductase [Amycolatopsis rhabdoformis]|uniref:FMN dependent NADH:quinone oxidoreductase n=1 Tax=Amycolatopsis rhabdoformis TaxID=1448059 RepID=A0ABZ1IJD4_9PSEU|nr:NAD(P)H-dependent oxidoreductase [Amycolatopsis rhabdoformis]WSE34560.1 NAD(P)H-dependent oxidoreductase [Amycolatopsis rhabdoformis]
MSYLLRIDASASGAASFSRRVADTFTAAWTSKIVTRDLALDPVGHLGAAGITARTTPAAEWSTDQAASAALQDELVEEFLGAEAYLFAVPMYNYSIPSAFKAWLDHVMIPGRTIGLGPNAAPTAGRPAVVVSARGGGYGPGAPQHGKDYLVPALRTLLSDTVLFGLDVHFITPELTFAPTVAELRHLLPRHEESLAESHALARKHALELTIRPRAAHAVHAGEPSVTTG